MFIIYVNSVPESVKPNKLLGYADNFKVIAKNNKEAEVLAIQIEKGSIDNQMILKMGKSKALCIKGETESERTTATKLGTVNPQKHVGVIMAETLS